MFVIIKPDDADKHLRISHSTVPAFRMLTGLFKMLFRFLNKSFSCPVSFTCQALDRLKLIWVRIIPLFNSTRPWVEYMRQWTGSSIQAMAFYPLGTKPWSEPTLNYSLLDHQQQLTDDPPWEAKFFSLGIQLTISHNGIWLMAWCRYGTKTLSRLRLIISTGTMAAHDYATNDLLRRLQTTEDHNRQLTEKLVSNSTFFLMYWFICFTIICYCLFAHYLHLSDKSSEN